MASEQSAQIDSGRVILYTLIGLAAALLRNFSNSAEKSKGYRAAFNYANPLVQQYVSRYCDMAQIYGDIPANQRIADYKLLVDARRVAEGIIASAHEYGGVEYAEHAELQELAASDALNGRL